MRTKKISVLFWLIFIGSLMSFGTKYEGIGKVKGQMMDLWVSIDITNNDATVNLGEGALTFPVTCKKTGTQQNPVFSFSNAQANFSFTLKSIDEGSTLEGKFPLGNNNFLDLWLLKLPEKIDKTTLSDQELKTILEDKEGYTSFLKMKKNDGTQALTSYFIFDSDGTFKFIGDSSHISEMFTKINGTYRISNGKVLLNLGDEMEKEGTIYNNGDYIIIPLGNIVRGGNFTIILIRQINIEITSNIWNKI